MAPSSVPSDDDRLAYEMVSIRRVHHDAYIWQTPVLGLTAQSFLFTIALGNGTVVARTVAAALALLVAALTLNLMIRHRAYEMAEAQWIGDYERRFGQSAQTALDPIVVAPRLLRWLGTRSAYNVWLVGLSLFGVASLLTLVLIWTPLLG